MPFAAIVLRSPLVCVAASLLLYGCAHLEVSRLDEAPSEPAAEFNVVEDALGYYLNRDGMYGSKQRQEYVHVYFEDGALLAKKLVGDRNVPRGKLTWRTERLEPDDLTDLRYDTALKASLQIRNNISDPNGFSWIRKGCTVRIHKDGSITLSFSLGGRTITGTFERISEEQAHYAVSSIADHN
mgnify:CR=1 FL=1